MAALLAAALALAGCAGIRVPLGADETVTNGTKEGAPAKAPQLAYEAVGNPDWEVVRHRIADGAPDADGKIAWTNPKTGVHGTISAVTPFRAKNGAPCRSFATTMATYAGVNLFRAEACLGFAGEWEITRVEPADPAGAT